MNKALYKLVHQHDLTPTQRLVLTALWLHYNEKGDFCKVSLSEIELATGYSRPTIIHAIKCLLEGNKIKKIDSEKGQCVRNSFWIDGVSKSIMNEKQRKAEEKKKLDMFEMFWEIYPRKRGKAQARKKFLTKVRNEKIYRKIMDNVRTRLKLEWKTIEDEFIPHPSTFLNKELYDDEIESPLDESGVINVNKML